MMNLPNADADRVVRACDAAAAMLADLAGHHGAQTHAARFIHDKPGTLYHELRREAVLGVLAELMDVREHHAERVPWTTPKSIEARAQRHRFR